MKLPAAGHQGIKRKLYTVIFEAGTPAGKAFDLILIGFILLGAATVMLESVESVNGRFSRELKVLEWAITLIFTVEYLLRLYVSGNKTAYAKSFFGLIDLLSILPSYLGLLFPGAHFLASLRLVRVLRIFRILKLFKYIHQSSFLYGALIASREKIFIFVLAVLTLSFIFGALIYVIEGPENGFTSIPRSVYWAIVTLSTVGYGDLSPKTVPGQMLTTIIIILGYGIIAVPTGIISSEMTRGNSHRKKTNPTLHCENCMEEGHDVDAAHCKACGHKLGEKAEAAR